MPVLVDPYDVATPAGTTGMGPTGDDTIREWKRAFVERYQVEHDLPVAAGSGSGRHKFPLGATGARPTDVVAGSIFLNTTLHLLDYWTGSVWSQVLKNFMNYVSAQAAGLTQALTTTDVLIPGTTVTAATDGVYIVLCHVDMNFDDTGSGGAGIVSLYGNGVLFRSTLFYIAEFDGDQSGVSGLEMNAPAQVAVMTAGDTLDLRVRKNTGPSSGTLFAGRITILRVI